MRLVVENRLEKFGTRRRRLVCPAASQDWTRLMCVRKREIVSMGIQLDI